MSVARLARRAPDHPRARLRLSGIPIAGAVSLAANLCVLKLALASGLSPHASWAVAFEVGTLVSFGVHQRITVRSRLPVSLGGLLGRVLRFQAGAVVAVVLNLLVFSLLLHAGLPLLLDDVAGIAAGFAVNTFVGLRLSFVR